MSKKKRFLNTINYKKVDRPASWLGIPTKESLPGLYDYFEVDNFYDLKNIIDDDIWDVELPYNNGTTNAIYAAFDFAKKCNTNNNERTLTKAGFFEDYEDASAVDLFEWPNPKKHISYDDCRNAVAEVPSEYAVLGVIWSAHFQDACAAFGMEDALVKMKLCPELFQAVIDKITDFYYEANEIFYQSTYGKLDAVLIGSDYGTQTGLIVSAKDLRKFVFKGTKRLIDQAHSYGLKVIHHSCGAISEIIPDLIECGADVIHPIQALAKGMDADTLKQDFNGRVAFCGGVDAQSLLVNGTSEEIRMKIKQLQSIFNTGLIISPSHEAVLADVPPQNIEAIFRGL